jgi:hypothetical protein
MQTALKLLMRDGAAQVTFQPKLSALQYLNLLERVLKASTKDELRAEMQRAAVQWGKRLSFDTEIL